MAAFAEDLMMLPVPMVLLIALALAFGGRRGRALAGLVTAVFLALCVPAIAGWIAAPLAGGAPKILAPGAAPPAAVVAPTGGVYDDGTGRWLPSRATVRRVRLGQRLARRFGVPLVVVGGAADPDGPPEAAAVAEALALPAGTILENGARDTAETARALARLFGDRGIRRVAVTTDALHVRRLSAALRGAGVTVALAATPPRRNRPGWRDYVPSGRGFSLAAAAWREYVGIAWYLARGVFGVGDL